MSAPLLLLPGMDGTGRLFAPFVAALPPHRRAITVRYPETLASYEELTRYAERFFPSEPCVIVAESFSGPVAAMLAAGAQERVLGLVLAASFVSPPLPRAFRMLTPIFYGPAAPRWLVEFLMGSKSTPPQVLDTLMEILQEAPDEMWRGRLEAALTTDAREALTQTRCPLLVLQAGSDRLLGPAAVHSLMRARPCLAARISGAPHLLLQSAPDHCVAAIENFLRLAAPAAGAQRDETL